MLILVGPGNNGGDALFAGARLAGRGARVEAVRCIGEPHPAGLRALVAAGADVLSIGEAQHSLEDVYLELIDTTEARS